MTTATTTQAMSDILHTVLESIFTKEEDMETFGMSITPTEGKIMLPTHVSLMGVGQLSMELRKKMRTRFRGNTVTLIVSG